MEINLFYYTNLNRVGNKMKTTLLARPHTLKGDRDCNKCKKSKNKCSCRNTWNFTDEKCSECKYPTDKCVCCISCKKYICECNKCLECKREKHRCKCCRKCQKNKCVCNKERIRCGTCNEQTHNCRCNSHCSECRQAKYNCRCCNKCLKYKCCCEVVIINREESNTECLNVRNKCLECERMRCICCKKCHRLECLCRLVNCSRCRKRPEECECTSPKICLECERPNDKCECCEICHKGICECPKAEMCRECNLSIDNCVCCTICYRKKCICKLERCLECNYPINECSCFEKKMCRECEQYDFNCECCKKCKKKDCCCELVICPECRVDKDSCKCCPKCHKRRCICRKERPQQVRDCKFEPLYVSGLTGHLRFDRIFTKTKNMLQFNITANNISSTSINSSAKTIKLVLDLKLPKPLNCDKPVGYFNISFGCNSVPSSGIIKYDDRERNFYFVGSIGSVGTGSVGKPSNGQFYGEGMYLTV